MFGGISINCLIYQIDLELEAQAPCAAPLDVSDYGMGDCHFFFFLLFGSLAATALTARGKLPNHLHKTIIPHFFIVVKVLLKKSFVAKKKLFVLCCWVFKPLRMSLVSLSHLQH